MSLYDTTLQGADSAEKDRLHISIPLFLVLTLITCGLFNLYWNYRQMEGCNEMLGRTEFKFWLWFFLSIITCGIYHIFYQYKMGKAILEIQQNRNSHLFDSLPLISVLVSIFGSTLIVDCIHQYELNKLVR